MNFDYLKPPKEVYKIKHSPEYIQHGEKEKGFRSIYSNVQYTKYEREQIMQLEKILNDKNIKTPIDWAPEQSLRFLYASGFDLLGKDGAVSRIQKYLDYTSNPKYNLLTSKAEQALKEGWIYLEGVDTDFRPVIVINAHMIDMNKVPLEDFLGAQIELFNRVKKHMLIPGIVENWVLLIETNNQWAGSLSWKTLNVILDVTGWCYPETVFKTYIINPSSSLSLSWKVVNGMISEKTAQKIVFVKSGEQDKLLKGIHPDQLEQKYGGNSPNLKAPFWPPKSPYAGGRKVRDFFEETPKEAAPKKRTSNNILEGEDFDDGDNDYVEPRGFNRNQFRNDLADKPNITNRETISGYINHTDRSSVSDTNNNGRQSFREKPKIFENRVTQVNHQVLTRIDRMSSPHSKIDRRPQIELEDTTDDYEPSGNSIYDLNDRELLELIKQENRAIRKDRVPDEEGEAHVLKEKVKGHSQKPLNVSNRYTHDKSPRASALGRPSAGGRPSARMSYNLNGGPDYDNQEVANWYIKKAPTEQEEEDDDDRGGLFCGICTSRKKKKAPINAPEMNRRILSPKLTDK